MKQCRSFWPISGHHHSCDHSLDNYKKMNIKNRRNAMQTKVLKRLSFVFITTKRLGDRQETPKSRMQEPLVT